MSDSDLLRAAIDAAGLSARRFSVEVLDVDERTVRRWIAGDRELHATVRVLCAAIVDDPPLAARLAATLSELRSRAA